MPPSNRTDADDLAVAVVLTLELAKIARVLGRFRRVARFIVNAMILAGADFVKVDAHKQV
jgi:hypothetical protein